jgi:hypothetical protein
VCSDRSDSERVFHIDIKSEELRDILKDVLRDIREFSFKKDKISVYNHLYLAKQILMTE